MYYVCTPIYVRCRNKRNCVQSSKICNGAKKCIDRWNSGDCTHVKRELRSMGQQQPSGTSKHFIGLLFQHFNFVFLYFFYRIDKKKLKQKKPIRIDIFYYFFNFF